MVRRGAGLSLAFSRPTDGLGQRLAGCGQPGPADRPGLLIEAELVGVDIPRAWRIGGVVGFGIEQGKLVRHAPHHRQGV